MPEVSVVIACLDAAETLGVQLEALSRQQCDTSWEVLLCDNGSRDRSLEIAESYRHLLPELRIIDATDRKGPGHARNVGVGVAAGALVVFCDADDKVAPTWLQEMVTALRLHQFVAGRFESEQLNDPSALRSRVLDQQAGLQGVEHGRPAHAGAGNMGLHREVFMLLGGFDTTIPWLEDTDLCWRAHRAGITLDFAPDAVVHVRLRSSLKSMYVQGLQYGRGHALLEQRYGRLVDFGGAQIRPDEPEPDLTAGPGQSAGTVAEQVAKRAREPFSLGKWVWQLGWRVGYRWFSHARYRPAKLAEKA